MAAAELATLAFIWALVTGNDNSEQNLQQSQPQEIQNPRRSTPVASPPVHSAMPPPAENAAFESLRADNENLKENFYNVAEQLNESREAEKRAYDRLDALERRLESTEGQVLAGQQTNPAPPSEPPTLEPEVDDANYQQDLHQPVAA